MKYLLYIFLILPLYAYSQAGSLDPTFGNNGVVKIKNWNYTSGFDIQDDQKIIWSGNSKISRLLSNGTIDSTFGINGVTSFYLNTFLGGTSGHIGNVIAI